MKQIQIPKEFYDDLLDFVFEAGPDAVSDPDLFCRIVKAAEEKEAAQARRAAYTTSKTAKDPDAREKARKQYLDSKGIPESFRW